MIELKIKSCCVLLGLRNGMKEHCNVINVGKFIK
jgi:hypothetical protein